MSQTLLCFGSFETATPDPFSLCLRYKWFERIISEQEGWSH
jgi:hypothetical protein